MKEKITIPFYNDLLFKYFVYDNEDEGCQYILKKIIEEIDWGRNVLDNKEFLGTEKISKLLFKLAVPSVVAQLVNLLYNTRRRVY